jgi:enamine deaminase RidA (YjgF/YER057c/UK114 family)
MKSAIVPPELAGASAAYRYSPAVLAEAPQLLFVSGQVGRDPEGNAIPEAREQYVAAFENVKSVLAHAGADFGDVVELVTFHVSFEDFDVFTAVKDEYVRGPVFPAWTGVGVTALALPGLLVEIKCTAVMPPR